MDDQDELSNCNAIKVLMMLAVMVYHSMALWNSGGWFNQPPANKSVILTYLAMWLNSFHVYVFTFVSGYLFYYLKYECGKYTDLNSFIKKKWNRLAIPYIFTAVLWVIPFDQHFFKPSIIELVNQYILAISPSQLWFLIMLFVLSIGFYLISDFINNQNFFYAISIFCIIYYGSYAVERFIPNILQIITVMRYAIFYYLGFSFRKYKPKYLYKIHFSLYFIIDSIFFIVFMVISMKKSVIFKIAKIFLQPCLNIMGTMMVFIGLNKIGHLFNTENKLYYFLKKYNFTLYLFHQQIIYCVIILFNGVVNPYVLAMLNLIIALFISGMVSVVLSKYRITRWMFSIK